MFKRLTAGIFLLAVMCGTSWGSTVIRDYPYDRYSLYGELGRDTYGAYLYSLYGDETGFNYELRELAGNNTAGNQWFATVYENFYYNLYDAGESTSRDVYRRTTGGEIPATSISAIGNIIGGFNFMTVEEKQPYSGWTNVYDIYPDPVESFCLVIKEGAGNFTVDFGNPYASHYPYWWHWTTSPSSAWWYDRSRVSSINEPIAYVADSSSGYVFERGNDGNYTEKYTFILSEDRDASGDLTGTSHYEVRHLNGNLAFKTSGDVILSADNKAVYEISGTDINDMSGDLKYTIENGFDDYTKYICEVRNVSESIRLDGFDNDYTFTLTPNTEQSVKPGDYYSANVRINTAYRNDYGSKLGYITFRQRADLMRGYTRYREYTTIPMVIANVADGNAADEPLQFDMTVYDSETERTSDHVVSRVKFTWDAQEDMPNQELGTFYMMQSKDAEMPVYYLETKITNRTGTRYELFRYDMMGRTSGFREIRPQYWKYDLIVNPSDPSRDTLPDHFHLDAHSQIAPGLVTVYDHSVYGTVNTAYDMYESFQLQEYNNPAPKNLRLNYTRVRGMYPAEMTRRKLPDDSAEVQGFRMEFTNVADDSRNTNTQLRNIMGKTPAMISAAGSLVSPDTVYIKSSALNAFRLSLDVPVEELDVLSVFDPNDPQTVTSPDNTTLPDTEQGNPEDNTQNGEGETTVSAANFTAAGYYSPDIAPLLPVSVRLVISGQNRLMRDHWNDLNTASSSAELFNKFRNFGTVWVRSSATRERDVDLFKAIDEQNNDTSASECVHAFLYDNALYLDFIAVIADAVSTNSEGDKTAFMKIFRDDGRPYILLGDGNIDGRWDLTFYVDGATGDNYTGDSGNSGQTSENTSTSGSSGGGGCNSVSAMAVAIILLGVMRLSTRKS